ncbi:MAG TPA: hypothetical protein VIF57_21865 [Polyangia bacterium]|jgi:hypothetical protein
MRWGLRRDLVGDTSVHESGTLRIVGSSLQVALVSGFTWAAGLVAALSMTCWGVGAWVILPVLVFATFVIALLVNGARVAIERERCGEPIALPDPEWFSDSAVENLARRLTGARARLERAMRESPRGPAFDVTPVRQGAAEIERRVIVLAARAEYVASFLSSTSVAEVNAALERARARARASAGDGDGDGRAQMYAGLIATYEGHLRSLRTLEAEKEKLLAAGEQLVGTLEGFPADLTRLQCLRLEAVDEDGAKAAVESAAAVRQSLGALEEALQDQTAPS